jgi:hypothetical protein
MLHGIRKAPVFSEKAVTTEEKLKQTLFHPLLFICNRWLVSSGKPLSHAHLFKFFFCHLIQAGSFLLQRMGHRTSAALLGWTALYQYSMETLAFLLRAEV